MKPLLPVLLILIFSSCTKKIDVVRQVHDTAYINLEHSTSIQFDTVVSHDTRTDTALLIKHDTLFITKIMIDTVFQHDTVYKINVTIQRDTVYKYQPLAGYTVPATDSVTIYLFVDTSHVLINYTVFTNLIASQDGTYQTFTTVPRYVLTTDGLRGMYGEPYEGWIITAPKMLSSVYFNYQLTGGATFSFEAYTPIYQPTNQAWVKSTPSHIGCNHCLAMSMTMNDIPLGSVVDLRIQ